MLGNLSIVHVLLLLIIIAMVFGTSRLKNLGKDLGSAINGFKEAMREGEQHSQAQPPEALNHTPPATPPTDSRVSAAEHQQRN